VPLCVHLASNLNSSGYLRHKLPKSLKLHSFSFSSTLIYTRAVNVCYMNAVRWVSFSACIWTRVPCEVLARWTLFFFWSVFFMNIILIGCEFLSRVSCSKSDSTIMPFA